MNSQIGMAQKRRWGIAVSALLAALAFSSPVHAVRTACAATNVATLQGCINKAALVGDTARKDTVVVSVAAGNYIGKQIRINNLKNLWVIGDTNALESAQPHILYQDRIHTYTDLDSATRADTSDANTYGQNNGTVWIHQSDNIRLEGLLIDGRPSLTNTAGFIFSYGAKLGKSAPVEIRGNVGVNVLLSRNVKLRYLSITNAWNGISVISPNLGGAFAFPDPNDPLSEVVATLPTSQAGLYGNHLIERCRIHDNTFGILFQRDWDLSSVIRNNLFWGNYLRHWGDPRTPAGYVYNLEALDKGKRADGSARSLAYTTVGGAFLMTDVSLTPYRIHNNTFHNNATIFSGYYKTGTQHLFYNNLVGRPYQFFRSAVDLPVQATDATYTAFGNGYTQTERNSEMLQYLSEHQRSNRVVNQDSLPPNRGQPNYWGGGGGNMRLYNMRMIRTSTGGWTNARSWSNDDGTRDSLGMTWVPDTAALGTIAQQADTGGLVKWIRHNMWTGARKDPMDPNAANWCPPWIPINIRQSLGDPKVFRNTSTFDVRWTLGLPLDTLSPTTSAAWLTPPLTPRLKFKGWPTYEGTATDTLAIGAYDPKGGWAAPTRRLILRDTLIESVTDSMVKFRLNVSGQGIADSQIVKLEVASSKFYNDVPVSDTFYNQGPTTPGAATTTTRVNSILSSKPWPDPYPFQAPDYNRPGFMVDDTLTKRKLRPDNVFLGRIGPGHRLFKDSLYARAEVVLKATLTDGSVVYSNPGVFMFSRPRFQFDVTVVNAITGKPLPYDADGISLLAQAHEPLKVTVKAKTFALPVAFNGYSWLRMGNAGELHGTDGNQLEKQIATTWSTRKPNDTVNPFFAKNDSVTDIIRAMQSPTSGTLIYRAVFTGSNAGANVLLPYYIEGRSAPIKVVSGSIYQVTIDSIYRDSTPILKPKYKVKMELNASSGGKRDTLLQGATDTSANLANVVKGEVLKVVLQVRDKFGNEVRDSSSLKKGLYIRLAHVLAPGRYSGSTTTDLDMVLVDSASTLLRSARLSFDSLGRAIATIKISEGSSRSTIAAIRAAIIDGAGREIGTPGASRDSGVADTAWVKTDRASMVLDWVDTTGTSFAPITDGWVGSWYPARVKIIKELKAAIYTGSFPVQTLSPVKIHPAKGDTTTLSTISFAGDSLSGIVWIRANDSVTGAWIQAGQDSLADRVEGMNFRYPQVSSASFHDQDCDGFIDSLVIRMNGPLSFRAASGTVSGDTLDVRFPHQFLSLSAMGAPERARIISDSIIAFGWNPSALGAADSRANFVTVGNPLVAGKAVRYTLSALKDLAPPVAISAFDQQSWTAGLTDSLVVKFSEAIDLASFAKGATPPFAVVRGGVRTPMAAVKLSRPATALADSGSVAFVFVGATGVLQKGDSLVVNGTSVSDLAGNLSGTTCPNKVIPIDFSPRFQPTQGWVIDVDGDGNADSVHLGFKDSLGSLPQTILVKWGTPAETMTVTKAKLIALGVKTSDSSITVPTVNWKGQTLIFGLDTVRNVPRTVGPMDTAWFDNGLSWEWLADRVSPVVVHARLKWGSSLSVTGGVSDTLVVDFSEKVAGCQVGSDPGLCLTAQGVKSAKAFSEGSTILSTEASKWTILVPRTPVSIGPNDSIRGTPKSLGGALSDLGSNVPGLKSPNAYVYGDPAPPRYGMMLDRNGDGRVDGVMLQYIVKPLVSTLPPFTFEWADSSGVTTVLRADSAFALDSLRWIAVLNVPGAFPVTGYLPASVKMTGTQESGSMRYPFPVRDSAGPVLKPRATLAPSSDKNGYDTVVVWPSEVLRDPTGSVLLEFRRGGNVVAATEVSFKSAVRQADGSWKVLVGPTGYRPMVGDETRLSTSGSVTDTVNAANKPSINHPWVALSGYLRTPYASAYLDANKDGRIDQATFDFASPVAAGTRIRVYDPAGTSTYREYVVAVSDSGKTRLEFDFSSTPWGVDVTSLVKPDLGVMIAAVGLDTNVFKGGRFNISDKAEPVITWANERYTSDTSSVDTLILKVSEWVGVDLSKFVIRYRPSGDLSDTGVAIRPDSRYKAIYDSAKGTLTLFLTPFPSGYSNPVKGDSLRLSWEGVSDKAGNSPGTKAKWTQVLANERVYPPTIHLTNPIVGGIGKSGDMLAGEQIELVGRGSSQDGRNVWSSLNGGEWKPGTSTYTPGMGPNGPGTGTAEDAYGTVVFIQTNVPTTIKVYIYDIVGTYVGKVSQYISKDMLDRLAKTSNSRTGMVDVGVLWKGQREDGRLVASGIYPIRLLALREPVEEEKAAGKVNNSIYNRLVNVGVKLRLK